MGDLLWMKVMTIGRMRTKGMHRDKESFVSWDIGGGRTLGPAPFFVVGIVNCTPDSFYDGGVASCFSLAVSRALALLDQGADILDLGGESTRPFAPSVNEKEELERVLPVVQEIIRLRPETIISIDTTKAKVAKSCLEAGARIINDVSALKADPALLDVLIKYQPGYVLMHRQGDPKTMQLAPHYEDVIEEIHHFFADHLQFLQHKGLDKAKVVLDPGIGFGKLLEHNLEILRHVDFFFDLGCPLYLGLSNKSLWRDFLGREGRERNAATLAATALLYQKGVRIHRVHEVQECCDALRVAHSFGQGGGTLC